MLQVMGILIVKDVIYVAFRNSYNLEENMSKIVVHDVSVADVDGTGIHLENIPLPLSMKGVTVKNAGDVGIFISFAKPSQELSVPAVIEFIEKHINEFPESARQEVLEILSSVSNDPVDQQTPQRFKRLQEIAGNVGVAVVVDLISKFIP